MKQQVSAPLPLEKLRLETDVINRVINANVVKLEKRGLVSFAGIQTPSGYKEGDFPECMSFTPASKAKQLLPPRSKVGVRIVEQKEGTPARALIVSNGKLINAELVRTGLAKPSLRGREEAEKLLPGLTLKLEELQAEAKQRKVGVYQTCEEQKALAVEFNENNQFEPLDLTVETQYYSDGGKQVLKGRSLGGGEIPKNPGDTKGCSDFETYEAALTWFDKYRPYYGDVAKLDPDNDGVPCPGLPHTQDRERYRMKVPNSVKNRVKGVRYDGLPNSG